MSFQGHQTTMTTKEMSKSFLPIILFSIVLPLIDIVTDLRIIIRLYSGVVYCRKPENNENEDDPDPVCELETHTNFATLLLGA